MRRFIAGLLLLGLVMGANNTALAGGGQAYPLGAEDFFAGAAPPPGFTFVNYFNYYTAGDLRDNTGHTVPVFDNVSTTAEVMRLIWFSNNTSFLGANYGQHFFLPIVSADLDFHASVGPRAKSHYSDTNVPYFLYSPVLLAWHLNGGSLHFVLDLAGIYIPLYNQDKGNLASVGRNFWTYEPALGVSWMPNKMWEVSAKFMYDFNSEQSGYALPSGLLVDRGPGQEFHFDYNVSYALRDNFKVGVSGYYYIQTTDDDFDKNGLGPGARAYLSGLEGEHSRVFAMGPAAWYQYQKLFVTLKAQFEMAAENKSEGSSLWFKAGYTF